MSENVGVLEREEVVIGKSKKTKNPVTLREVALEATGLTPFIKKEVKKYKKNKIREESTFLGRHPWMRFVTDTAAVLVLSGVILISMSPIVAIVLLVLRESLMLAIDLFLCGVTFFIVGMLIVVFIVQILNKGNSRISFHYYWRRSGLSNYMGAVPEFAQQTANDISGACRARNLPEPKFYVDYFDLKTYRCPFLLSVDRKGNELYWEVWDEKFPPGTAKREEV